MRALQISGPGLVEELSVPTPDILEDELLIRVSYSGICATDYEILGGEMALIREGKIKFPVRFGHEWVGVVEKVGSAVTKFSLNDRVISDSGIACGHCAACQKGDYAACSEIRSVGTVNCWDGSFAEYIKIPERHLHKVPDCISQKEATVIEPASISLVGVEKLGNLTGKSVLVVGTGAIGMCAVAFAKYKGAAKVYLAGRTDEKLEIGKKMGADRVINIRKESLADVIVAETNGKGVFGVIETSGNIEAVEGCLKYVSYGGIVVYIGFYDKTVPNFAIDLVVSNELTVAGVMGHFGSTVDVIHALESGIVDLTPIITHIIPFDQAKDAMMHPEKIPGVRVKILVDCQH